MRRSRSARIDTRSLVPPGARFSRRISSCRRGSEAKCRSLASSSLGCARQLSIACGKLFPVRTEVAGQRCEECKPLGFVEMAVAVEHLARHRGAGGLAPARQQRLAQFDQFGAIGLGVGPHRGEAGCGRARKSRREGRRKRRCCSCWAKSNPDPAEFYMGFRPKPITIKRAKRQPHKGRRAAAENLSCPARAGVR